MLRLVARHADAWNAAWFGRREEATALEERIGHLREACAAEDRDPATISLTAGLFVSFPALQGPEHEDPPGNAMSGDAAEVGRELALYAELGIEHVIAHVWPPNAAGAAELGRAAERARADARIGAHG